MTAVVGVDVGTSAIKAVVIDDQSGAHLSSGRALTPWTVHEGTVESSVARFTEAVSQALAVAIHAAGGIRISAIGFTSIAESGVLVDSRGIPTSPVVAWHDNRGRSEFEAMVEEFGGDELALRTGQLLDVRLSAAKIRYFKNAGIGGSRWLSVPELLVEAFGGHSNPDRSQWSRTGLLDIRTGEPMADVCEWAGLEPVGVDSVVFSGTPMGTVARGFPIVEVRDAVLTTAGQDHVCAAMGAGVTSPHQLCDSWGNGEALVRPVDTVPALRPVLESHVSLSWGLTKDHVLFSGLGTGLVLKSVLEGLGLSDRDRPELDRRALGSDSEGGLPMEAVEAWREALDAAFVRVQRGVEDIEELGGPVDEVVGCGGWLKSPQIVERKSSRVTRFRASQVDEPAAVGAALLAMRAMTAA